MGRQRAVLTANQDSPKSSLCSESFPSLGRGSPTIRTNLLLQTQLPPLPQRTAQSAGTHSQHSLEVERAGGRQKELSPEGTPLGLVCCSEHQRWPSLERDRGEKFLWDLSVFVVFNLKYAWNGIGPSIHKLDLRLRKRLYMQY